MGRLPFLSAVVISAVAGVSVSWVRFSSAVFPYSIMQPSSYRHIVSEDALGGKGDYFFPNLGSFTTNVNIRALPGHVVQDETAYLHSLGGRHVRRVGTLRLSGKAYPIESADFRGLVGSWTVQQATFTGRDLVWTLTASFDAKYVKMRPQMLRMLQSFQLR